MSSVAIIDSGSTRNDFAVWKDTDMGMTEPAPSVAGMDLRDYVRILRHRWLLVAAATVLGVIAAAVPVAFMTPTYEAHTQLYVSVRSDAGETGDLVQGNSFAKEVVSSYTDIIGTSVVLDPVISELGLNTTVAELRNDVKTSTPDGSVLIDITVADTDPQQAELIAAAISRSLTRAVQNRLEPKRADGQSSVSLTTTQEAQTADEPVSPRASLLLPAGLLLGLLCGIGIAVLTAVFDTRVRSARDVRQLTDIPVIGRIPRDSVIANDPLVVRASKHGPTAEAFRALRTNLDFLGVGSRSRIFVITSSSLGEGKSITAVNLSIILAESGLRVALVDCDLRRPKIAEYLGIEGAAGLTDVLVGRAEIADVLQPWGEHGLNALPAGHIPPNPSELLGSHAMDTVLQELDNDFDYVILDAPPTLAVTDSAVVGTKAAGIIMVAAAGSTKKPALDESIRTHQALGARVAGVVVTMLHPKGEDLYSYGAADAYGKPPVEADRVTTASGSSRTVRSNRRYERDPSGDGIDEAIDCHPEGAPSESNSLSGPKIWPICDRSGRDVYPGDAVEHTDSDVPRTEELPRVGAVTGDAERQRGDEN